MTPAELRIDAQTTSDGWLGLPELADDAARAGWVQEQLTAMRESAGMPWDEAAERYIRALLEAGSVRRRPDDVLAFQVWPAAVPACVFVHVAFGVLPADAPRPGAGDAIVYDAEGVGAGLQIPLIDEQDGAQTLGLLFLFRRGDEALVVELEPTAPELVALVMPALHGFVQSITVAGDEPFRADPPLGAAATDTWIDTLRAS